VFLNGVAAQTLVAATTYYIYAFLNSGVVTADFSATGHSPSATAGNVGTEIKTGDDTRTLIGMVRTGATVIYASDLQTASWFNRRNKAASSLGSAIANGGNVPAINFVTWAEEAYSIGVSGIGTQGTLNANLTVQLQIDAGNVGSGVGGTTSVATGNVPAASGFTLASSEGNHAMIATVSVNAGTTSYTGTSYVMVHG
jgi:hypothetical protein